MPFIPYRSHAIYIALASAIALALPAAAQEKSELLPQSGSFKTHTGFKNVGTVHKIADDHIMADGTGWGVVYNDDGRGILHMGAVMCPHFDEIIGASLTEEGECAWSDVNGDKIFTRFSAKGDMKAHIVTGDQSIVGGTGKFAGIEGKAPFKCHPVSAEGQLTCATEWTYQITATGASEARK